jgi:hypothetical protein
MVLITALWEALSLPYGVNRGPLGRLTFTIWC